MSIDGDLEGAVDIPGYRLTTGKSSFVNAAVSAAEVLVNGRLDGHVTADFVDWSGSGLVTAHLFLLTPSTGLRAGGGGRVVDGAGRDG